MNVALPMWGASRLMRPPVSVTGPVSIRWTTQSGFAPPFMNYNGAVASTDGEVRAIVMQLQEISVRNAAPAM
jgi:hypothetical protein